MQGMHMNIYTCIFLKFFTKNTLRIAPASHAAHDARHAHQKKLLFFNFFCGEKPFRLAPTWCRACTWIYTYVYFFNFFSAQNTLLLACQLRTLRMVHVYLVVCIYLVVWGHIVCGHANVVHQACTYTKKKILVVGRACKWCPLDFQYTKDRQCLPQPPTLSKRILIY
jgi:hypothetical protein